MTTHTARHQHAARCKESLAECKVCADNVAYFSSLPLSNLSSALENPVARPASFQLSTLAADALTSRALDHASYDPETKLWSQKPRANADCRAAMYWLTQYKNSLRGTARRPS